MKQVGILLILSFFVSGQSVAAPPAKVVDAVQQAARDGEKLQILIKELNEQRNQAADLNQQKALVLLSDKKDEAVKIEARLEEANGNIEQLEQEINLAQGRPAITQPASAKVKRQNGTATVSAEKTEITAAAIETRHEWWDLYHRKARSGQ
ncbi:hypothetical protein MCAMS1_01186 [biofilm metagenome]